MKSILWIGGIIGAGLLVGYAWRLAATPASSATADAPIVAAHAQYKVGDHLQQAPDLEQTPYHPSSNNTNQFKEIAWESLIPKSWDAMAPFKGLKLDKMQDDDPRAVEALWKAKQYWKNAPVDPGMDGTAIRIPGFVVSLEREGEALKEFLLVPYFGACIHVPPPPANQIIHVHSSEPVQGVRTMDAVWVNGILKVDRSDTVMGSAGYSMTSVKVEPYLDKTTQ